jgi:glycosyltransferase involved in cell wall biosynthesis
MKEPLVSICIPTYNGELYLKECLDSVVSQSYDNIEIIIIDDKSSDGTVGIINSYLVDGRICLYRNEINLGLVGNWNRCIELANGEWIKFVFQDDLILPDCIEKMLNAANGNSLIACKRTFLLDGNVDDQTKKYYQKEVVTFEKLGVPCAISFISHERISQMAAENICMNFIGEPTSVMFKKAITSKIGFYNDNLTQICDLEYCLRIAVNYGVIYVPETLTRFRIHSLSTTSTNLDEKRFTLSNIDPIIIVRQLLYDTHYSALRNSITFRNKIKLQKYFSVRAYEAYRTTLLCGLQSEEMKKFNSIAKVYPEIDAYKYPSLNTKLLYQVVRIRRKVRHFLK